MEEKNFVETSLGVVDVVEEDGTVTVTFYPNDPATIRAEIDPAAPTMRLRRGRPAPKVYQEVTQNGSTFEVLDVRRSGTGYDVLNGNTGVWERWLED